MFLEGLKANPSCSWRVNKLQFLVHKEFGPSNSSHASLPDKVASFLGLQAGPLDLWKSSSFYLYIIRRLLAIVFESWCLYLKCSGQWLCCCPCLTVLDWRLLEPQLLKLTSASFPWWVDRVVWFSQSSAMHLRWLCGEAVCYGIFRPIFRPRDKRSCNLWLISRNNHVKVPELVLTLTRSVTSPTTQYHWKYCPVEYENRCFSIDL